MPTMRSFPPARLVPLALALALSAPFGCAVGGLTPIASNEPVARMTLAPEFRVFYDALADYGDWVLIEPYGFVFRPHVTWGFWRPFADGYWAPTDTWGWVWISAEPFGWATYHYGSWFYDDYQGWVWQPGVDWSPGGVSWLVAGDYVGWGPLQSGGTGTGAAADPNLGMSFAPIAQLGTTDLSSRLVPADQIAPALQDAKPIRNLERVEGETINRGPPFEMVEARSGGLVRARIQDLVPGDLGRRIAGSPLRGPAGGPGRADRDSLSAAAREAIDLTQRAGERAASEARGLLKLPQSNPAVLPMVRPLLPPRDGGNGSAPSRREGLRPRSEAPRDTTR